MGCHWTEEEDAELRQVYRDGKPLKMQLHRFNGRSARQVARRAALLKLGAKPKAGVSTLWLVAMKVLPRDKALSCYEVADALNCSRGHGHAILRDAVHRGEAHVARWRRATTNGRWMPLFMLRPGKSVEKPQHRLSAAERTKRYEKKIGAEARKERARRYQGKYRARERMPIRDPLTAALYGDGVR